MYFPNSHYEFFTQRSFSWNELNSLCGGPLYKEEHEQYGLPLSRLQTKVLVLSLCIYESHLILGLAFLTVVDTTYFLQNQNLASLLSTILSRSFNITFYFILTFYETSSVRDKLARTFS
jgi:hypothetical protein